jgi:hypothetical protein
LPENVQKLELGENHRRVVSAVLRRVELTCEEILAWLERPGGELLRLQDDITPALAGEIRKLVAHLKQETQRVQKEMLINISVESRARGVAASVSLTRVEIQEILTPGLRGYGWLPQDIESALDAKFARLLSCLDKILMAVGQGAR